MRLELHEVASRKGPWLGHRAPDIEKNVNLPLFKCAFEILMFLSTKIT